MPGYNVVGIDCDSQGENLIAQSGAIHCITHSVAVEDPLVISHLPLRDTEDTENSYVVVADVGHRSGIESVTLRWATSPDGPWNEVAMTANIALLHLTEFAGAIPAQAAGTEIHYYVHAEATSGKTGTRPMPAPEGWWSFRVLGNVDGLDTPEASSPWRALYPNLPRPSPAWNSSCLVNSCAVTLTNAMGQTLKPCIKARWLGNAAHLPRRLHTCFRPLPRDVDNQCWSSLEQASFGRRVSLHHSNRPQLRPRKSAPVTARFSWKHMNCVSPFFPTNAGGTGTS